jgi:apolipoprotein N-acyltransferase
VPWPVSRTVSLPNVFLSAFLFILTFPNFNCAETAWIALVPLIIAIRQKTPRQAFFYGWISGTVAYAGILYWLLPTFRAAQLSLGLGLGALLALSAYMGLFWGVWTWWMSYLRRVDVNFTLILGAAAWVILEYVRTFLFSGFPWALFADSQVYRLPVIQIASITGVYGVSFLLVWGNLAVAEAFNGSRRALASFGIALLCTLSFGWVTLKYPKRTGLPELKIALLQGNIDQYKKWSEVYVAEIKQTYETLVQRSKSSGAQLIVWPETSVPGYLTQDPPLRLWLTSVILKSGTAHIVGAPYMQGDNAYNAAFSLSSLGLIQGVYGKHHLVPFGETVPFQTILGRWISVLNALGGFTAGRESPVLTAAGVPIGVNICYEAIFPNLVRQSVKHGAQIIVNLTNDGWYMKTAAPYQHLAPNVFRAVENRRWLARADNTGISALIDPFGHIVLQTPIYQARVLIGTAELRSDLTFYSRYGDFFAWLCLLGTALYVRRRNPKKPS